MEAYWIEDERRPVASAEALQEVFGDVRALAEPTMLFMEHANGRTLVLGLGAERSVLTFVEADGTSFHSLGDKDEQGFLTFWCCEQEDEFMAEMAVPESVAVEAAESFQATGEKPAGVTWEADW